MKIAVTSQNRREITGHAGRCRNFQIYDIAEDSSGGNIKGKELLELPKEQSLHEHRGASHPVLDQVQVFISGGMGQGMRNRLAERNIRGIVTEETDPDKAIRDFLNGSLVEKESSHGGSDHHHDDHGCGCSHREVAFFPHAS
uniref:Predicted Fe-Mo cluster-binding protein, NifX family n=1 Tax=Candidatus Kentrum sp. TC TaxID=2126339 RepID=A0A450ZV30_9GAMM|nr:MAG: Predicted Fe-Mo cluster-binding protein, NifX family [Candidatus Kentron sp. TC]VFK57635.1 MAG: Predicted Fe-Mo cluster-binding protein, NifX family [Candidatus Kentron sp. TC]